MFTAQSRSPFSANLRQNIADLGGMFNAHRHLDRAGTNALDLLNGLKVEDADRFKLRTASDTPLGFRDDEPGRWEVFREGVEKADFMGSLPEADDVNGYPEKSGFMELLRGNQEESSKVVAKHHV